MLCRECRSYYDCVHQYFKSDSHALRCPPVDYPSLTITREMLFEIFSFRHFISLCVQWKSEDANWLAYCRDQYRDAFNELVTSPQVDCLSKTQSLYETLDLFCKDEVGVNFFYYGRRYEHTYGKNPYFRRVDSAILKDWTKYGEIVWAELEKAQNRK